ncbi:putative protein OS=Streptomyces griseomycini OX=66895 GN=FHS37_006712 PE=4 SV=1 [Streptomyces griseomycini]|uniref:Uncharacterized protein n=1 Tax=Streptomyces griseomycini TaxID=66895 RepID=A0A7W7PWK5_9ACTN|nr:hypothetical protein [Streptomyces griseomycini]GGR54478.1 hypothetical protein GCM10015536_69850 [Streptomyces griseomycini]
MKAPGPDLAEARGMQKGRQPGPVSAPLTSPPDLARGAEDCSTPSIQATKTRYRGYTSPYSLLAEKVIMPCWNLSHRKHATAIRAAERAGARMFRVTPTGQLPRFPLLPALARD